ncbi:MAG TPA: hypothetical protein VLE95_08770 [Chlamydiales bacterium]|nr:hypothetical protein [Chlamydiales bacterium]
MICALDLHAFEKQNALCYPVSCFDIVYNQQHPRHPPISDLMNLPIEIGIGPKGYTNPNGSCSTYITLAGICESCTTPAPIQMRFAFQEMACPCFDKSALQTICASLCEYLKQRGLDSALVQIASDEISADGRDGRKQSCQITLQIKTFSVGELGAWHLNEKNHPMEKMRQLSYIISHSPMQPIFTQEGTCGDLFSQEELDAYLSFLNRHPNRSVDARIYPLYHENQIGIDYLVAEHRPWRIFGDVGNTGNHVTGLWQETIGFLHTQLTGVDDIFRFDWTTDSFHSYYTFVGSYDRPILVWPRARWKLFGMFNRYAASDLGFSDKIFVGTQGVAELQFKENAAQAGSFFFDCLEGIRYYNIHVTHRTPHVPKEWIQFAAPTFGFTMEQKLPLWGFCFKFLGITSPNQFLASSRKHIDRLGRVNTNKGWTILNGSFFARFYTNSEKPIHEFLFAGQGQYAFQYRLIPQLKFVVGGFNTVRGYPEAINSGDSAFVARWEYIFHLSPVFPSSRHSVTTLFGKNFRPVPEYPGDRADWDVMFRAFIDTARSIDNHCVHSLEKNSTLLSTGLGTEIDLWQNLMIRLDWGITLQKAVKTDAGHSIVYLNSTVAY